MNYKINHDYRYEVTSTLQIFYTFSDYDMVERIGDGKVIESIINEDKAIARYYENGNKLGEEAYYFKNYSEKETKIGIKISIFKVLSKIMDINPKWGILTGIRPAKIVRNFREEGLRDKEIIMAMEEEYLVNEDKTRLALEVAKKQEDILKNNNDKIKSLYIGIPFCPTKCLYCSFTSYQIDIYKDIIDDYINSMFKEIDYASEFLEGNILENIYMGGGTPTSISASDLDRIFTYIEKKLDLSNIKEYCVEAGRPDTIDKEKLEVFKKHNINRISINPQTMNNKTLKLIGREHTVEDFIEKYHLAEELGFTNINIDLILGLPDETLEDVIYTLEEISKLKPKSVTIHTLAIKKASRLIEELDQYDFRKVSEMEEMLDISRKYMDKLGLEPYYLYRQKNMVGNFENVGYAKLGYEGIYNVQIMEEEQDIIAIGAGSTSKYINFETNRIDRAFNVKEPRLYIERIDEMIIRKKRLEEIKC